MPTLPELRPDTFITGSGVTQTTASLISDESDTTYLQFSGSSGNFARYSLTNTPSDFVSMDSPGASVVLRMGMRDPGDDNWQVVPKIVDANGNTLAGTASPSIQSVSQTGTIADYTFQVGGTTLSKADWDGAYIEITLWTFSASMGNDNNLLRVYRAGVTGTYTASSPNTTATPGVIASTTTVIEPGLILVDQPTGLSATYWPEDPPWPYQIQLEWDAFAINDEYDVERDSVILDTILTPSEDGRLSYYDETVVGGQTYTYRVRARQDGVESPWSSGLSVSVPLVPAVVASSVALPTPTVVAQSSSTVEPAPVAILTVTPSATVRLGTAPSPVPAAAMTSVLMAVAIVPASQPRLNATFRMGTPVLPIGSPLTIHDGTAVTIHDGTALEVTGA